MFQQITLVGNLGQDPEMRYTPSGVPVTSFSLAVNRVWTGQDGQRQEKTTWFRVTAWRRDAELASQYLSKGRQVLVVGEMEEARPWTDKDGNQRASLEVTARTIRFIGSRGDSSGGDYGNEEHAASGSGSNSSGGGAPAMQDEDIPF